jgi:hypothetical protein
LNVKSISSEKTKYVLPAYALNVSSTYLLQVSVRDPREADLKFVSIGILTVVVAPLPLVPVITPNRAVIQYRLGDAPIVLQALNSYDPNVQRRYSEPELQSLFEFSWQCLTVNSDYLSAQGGYLSNQELLNYWLVNDATTYSQFSPCTLNISLSSPSPLEVLVSSTNMTSVDNTSLMILTMRESPSSAALAKQSSVAIQINVIPAEAPMITIETLPSTVSNVNVQNRLILSGSVLTKSTCIASWSLLDNPTFHVADITASPSFVKQINPNVPTPVILVIKSNAFPSEVASYTLALSCGDSVSKIVVTTNGPPTGGIFTIVPTEGQELNTLFSLNANQWNDADLPLSYQFGYYPSSSKSHGVVICILYASIRKYCNF